MTLKRTLIAASAAVAFSLVAGSARADDYSLGMNAFKQRDYLKAIELWTPLANAGHTAAQYNLARMYDNGIGVDENDERAAVLYTRAVEDGFVPAMIQLGEDYIEGGEGVPQDPAQGILLLRSAASEGDAEAQFQLGMLYREGEVVQKDYIEAMRWYTAAANQDHAEAQYMIGFMYGSGYGVPQDFVMAYYYYSLAAEEINISIPAREHLAEYMTAAEITKAMGLVSEQRTVASTGQSLTTQANP